MLDHADFAIVEGGICTTLRDLARFGLLCLEDGRTAASSWSRRLDHARRVRDPDLIRRTDVAIGPIRPGRMPSTTTTGGSSTGRAGSTRRSA